MENIKEFIEKSKFRFETILERLDWKSVMSTHNANVNKKPETSPNDELSFPPSCATQNSVVLENDEVCKLLNKPKVTPHTFSELQINFDREEKLLLYEHVKSRADNKVTYLDESTDLVSLADIVALKKREKKNRRKHRVSKPTHIEELRSLVNLQMQSLEQHLQIKYGNYGRAVKTEKRYQSPQNREEKRHTAYEKFESAKTDSSSKKRERISYNERNLNKSEKYKRRRSRSNELNRTHYRSRSRERYHRKESRDSRYNERTDSSNEKLKHRNRSRSRSPRKVYTPRKRSRSHSKHRTSQSNSRSRLKNRLN